MSEKIDMNQAEQAFLAVEPPPLSPDARRLAITRFGQINHRAHPRLVRNSVLAWSPPLIRTIACSGAFAIGLFAALQSTSLSASEAELADAATFSLALFP